MEYYKATIEPFEVAAAWEREDYRWVNILKYVKRAGRKPGVSMEADLLKLIDYAWALVYEENPYTDFKLPELGISATLRHSGPDVVTSDEAP